MFSHGRGAIGHLGLDPSQEKWEMGVCVPTRAGVHVFESLRAGAMALRLKNGRQRWMSSHIASPPGSVRSPPTEPIQLAAANGRNGAFLTVAVGCNKGLWVENGP
jgi:hypothetical protein